MPDYADMTPFAKWWETKGWWLARRLSLSEDVMKQIWQEGYKEGVDSPRLRDRWTERYEDLGDLRGEY